MVALYWLMPSSNRLSPGVRKPDYRPTLTSTGWLSRSAADGTAIEEEDVDEVEEEFVPLGRGGGGWEGMGECPAPIFTDPEAPIPGNPWADLSRPLGLTCQDVSGSPALDSGLLDTKDPGRPRRNESQHTLHTCPCTHTYAHTHTHTHTHTLRTARQEQSKKSG